MIDYGHLYFVILCYVASKTFYIKSNKIFCIGVGEISEYIYLALVKRGHELEYYNIIKLYKIINKVNLSYCT